MKRLAEVGANGQWGIFSQSLPGRVGYQCSNYYRLLLQKGALKDDNYFIDEKGKAHYLFSTKKNADGTPRVDESEGQEGEGEGESGSTSGAVGHVGNSAKKSASVVRRRSSGASAGGKKKRRRRDDDDDEDEDVSTGEVRKGRRGSKGK